VQAVASFCRVHPVAHAGWQPSRSQASPHRSPSRLTWVGLGTRGQLSDHGAVGCSVLLARRGEGNHGHAHKNRRRPGRAKAAQGPLAVQPTIGPGTGGV
jgi:hypothetical protein